MAYGSVVFAPRCQGLWPEKKASEITMNINDLADNLSNMKINILGKCQRKCLETGATIKKEEILKEIPSPVLDIHEKHMDKVSTLLEGDERSDGDYGRLSDCDFD